MNGRRTGPRTLRLLQEGLSDRDLAIIGRVFELRLVTGLQLQKLFFPTARYKDAASAARTGRQVLSRLTADRLLVRLDRRVGGMRAGSSSFTYAIGPVGQRLLNQTGARKRFREPTTTFLHHTLAVSELVVELTLAARSGGFELLLIQTEPRCWRQFSGPGGSLSLRPDLFVSLGVGDYEERWFVEVDLGTEHMPAVLRKCRAHEAYLGTGKEEALHGVHPKVCWIVPKEHRAKQITRAVEEDSRLTNQLFVTTTDQKALSVLTGAVL